MCIDIERTVAKLHCRLKKAVMRCNKATARYLDAMNGLYVEGLVIRHDGTIDAKLEPLHEHVNPEFAFCFATAIRERCDIFRKVNEFGMYRSIQQSKFDYLRNCENMLLTARDHVNEIADELSWYERIQPSLFDSQTLTKLDSGETMTA